mmetsp:Transcript_76927/g.217621  ORF Transcript_76927/g.217621 Transcript_76927/m.217621 type:complete len:269 (+) Transcript_76927:72-878(+)
MIRIGSIYHEGEVGEFRAGDDAVGWKGADGSRAVVHASGSVLQADWLEGTFKILFRAGADAAKIQVFTLQGFANSQFDEIARHFQDFYNVRIKRHGASGFVVQGSPERAVPTVDEFVGRGDGPRPAAGPAAVPASRPPPETARALLPSPRKPAHGGRGRGAGQCHPGSILEGWVWKQSRYLRQWRRRWFVLMPQRLDSYKEFRGGDATETIYAGSIVRAYAADDELNLGRSFCIAAGDRKFFVVCDNEEQRQDWIREISGVLLVKSRC